jgi:hypothetical protein
MLRLRTSRTTTRACASSLLLAGLAGCQGVISGAGGGVGGSEGGPLPPGLAGGNGSSSVGVPGAEGVDNQRVVLRRLNRVEYNNTVADLLGTTLRPADEWPGDDISIEGFDTIGLILNFTPRHGEQTERAASQLAQELVTGTGTNPARARIMGCTPAPENADECSRRILSGFMKRAYRRPVTTPEVDDLVSLAAETRAAGATPAEGLTAALSAVLLSPHFLYRVELDPDPRSAVLHPVTDHELASRLSYFAWSTMPDDALFEAADAGRLTTDPAELVRQFTRLMDDPRSDTLLTSLSNQWLQLHHINEVAPAAEVFPDFDEALRLGMRDETERFFRSLVREALPLDTLLLADFTFADARLAQHYGLGVSPTQMQRVSLAGAPRLGLLTQTSFLSITSFPERTSPVVRGSWVVERLLCSPPPAPPPGVSTALNAPTVQEGLTLREKLVQHRADPQCAACHALFDPVGFGLENYDAVGSYRTLDNGQPVDASGALSDGPAFVGALELARVVASDPRFEPCVAEQVLTYGVGRSFRSPEAKAYTEHVASSVRQRGGSFRALLEVIASSEAFLTRRGEAL